MTEKFLTTSTLLDFYHPLFDDLFEKKGWDSLPEYKKIGAVYYYVQNGIR